MKTKYFLKQLTENIVKNGKKISIKIFQNSVT